MADNWIPVRESVPDNDEWKNVMTSDGTVYPAVYKDNKWKALFRGGDVELLMHGKVLYWQDHPQGYSYVQCKCGAMFLQAEGRKECPICSAFKGAEKPKKKKAEEIPFSEPVDKDIEEALEE